MYKSKFFTACLMALTLGFASCSSSDSDLVGNWVQRNDFKGVARYYAATFTIDNIAYVVGGYDSKIRQSDMYAYDNNAQTWTKKASMPGTPRHSASAFAAGGKGYVGLGNYDSGTGVDSNNCLKDFYCYDPATDSWSQIADFPSARHSAVAFSINGKGYVGTGYDGNHLSDFYCYDPSAGTWTSIADIGGRKRKGASAFVMGNYGYVVCGDNNSTMVNDFWMYDPSSNSWTEKRKIADASDQKYDDKYNIVRTYAVAFTMGSKAYVTCGQTGSVRRDTWEYDPSTDLWEEKTSFEGSAREGAVAFTVNGRGFVTTGRSSSYRFEDMWEFFPFDEYNEFD